MKYRKKPIVIEAMKLTRQFADVVFDWIGNENIISSNNGEFTKDSCYVDIVTLVGSVITVREGDYIIKGIMGEIYSCKPEIFEASYDKVEE